MKTIFTGRDYAAAALVVLIWGTNFVAMKLALRELSAFQLGAARYAFAVLPLILFVRPPALPARWLLLYGVCQGIGQFGLLFLALRAGLSAALASVVLQTQVFFTALFGALLLAERVHRPLKVGLVLAGAGLLAFGASYAQAGQRASIAGFALCIGAAAMWALSNIVVRQAQRATPRFEVLPFMVWSSLIPILPFAAMSLVADGLEAQAIWARAHWHTWASAAYLGWFATMMGYALWTGLLQRHPANRVAPFSLGVPLIGVAAGMLLLGERIAPLQWLGTALLLAALASVMLGPLIRARA